MVETKLIRSGVVERQKAGVRRFLNGLERPLHFAEHARHVDAARDAENGARLE
jgi:hypothetical protein